MIASRAELEAKAIEGCDSEPIHTPGYIQPCGVVMGLDKGCSEFLYASNNLEQFLGIKPAKALASLPSDVLSKKALHDIANLAGRSTATRQRELVGDIETLDGWRKATAHVRNGTTIVEISGLGDIPLSQSEGLDRLRWLTQRIDQNDSLPLILADAVKNLRAFSGYNRVMAYRFRPDGSGEVIAEDRVSDIDSYLGLRFPEFDIPKQARQLYLSTPIRMISDIDGEQIGLVSKPGMPQLDMSLALSRGTMPVHCDYLRNMGVRASMSLPIVVGGKLWGLFAFHHRSPRYLGSGVSLAIEFAGQYLNLVIESALKAEESRCELRAIKTANTLFARRDNEKASGLSWGMLKDDLLKILPANGVAYCEGARILTHGDCPPAGSLEAIHAALSPTHENISISDQLAQTVSGADLGNTAGALRIKIGEASNASITYFRNQATVQVAWAGAPEKQIDTSQSNLRLTPRGSFAAFKMEMAGRSESWEPQDIVAATGLFRAAERAYLEAVDRDALLENLELMVQELNHRVRNILALVKSIIEQSRSNDPDLSHYFESLEARILSLANAHNALTENNSRSIDLHKTIRIEAAPFSMERVAMAGPTVGISPRAASIFVLVLHELFANAAKHGAFSTEQGRLDLSWRLSDKGLHISWVERNGPAVSQPQRFGFGQTLIQNALSYEFGGDAEVKFLTDGIRVALFLPHAVLVLDDEAETKTAKKAASSVKDAMDTHPVQLLSGNVLILEDDFLIATQTKQSAQRLGADKAILASNIADAMALIADTDIRFAILDINLGGDRSLPVAQCLMEMNTPFIFATGYSGGEGQLTAFPTVPVVRKPFQLSEMADAISKANAK